MAKAKFPPPKEGRPSNFTEEVGEFICETIAVNPKPLWDLCREHELFPADPCTINRWRWKHPEFGEKFNKAKEFQAQILAEEIIEISDDKSQDWIENKKGQMVFNVEHVKRSQLRIDARKYVAGKLARRHYGERMAIEHTGFSHDKWCAGFKDGLNQTGGDVNDRGLDASDSDDK